MHSHSVSLESAHLALLPPPPPPFSPRTHGHLQLATLATLPCDEHSSCRTLSWQKAEAAALAEACACRWCRRCHRSEGVESSKATPAPVTASLSWASPALVTAATCTCRTRSSRGQQR